MHRIRWAPVAALAAAALLGIACSGGGTKADPAPTKATAAGTAAPGATSAAATAAAKATAAASPSAADGTARAIISNFTLPTLTVKAGTVVEFVNQDSAGHTATSDDKATFDSKTLSPGGGAFKYTASKPGTFPYTCTIHPAMKGSITVQ